MRRFSTSLAVAVLAGLLVSSSFAQQASITTVPNLVRYGATLKDTQGAPVSSSTVGITFALYKQQDGGASIWMETQNVTTDTSGNYSVLLGSTTAAGLPSDLFSQQEQRWLDVQVEGQAEQPRVLLVSVPYAFKAHEAETLGGKSVSDFVLANGASSAVNGTANQASPSNANSLPTTAAGIRKGAASAGPTNFSGSTTDQIVQVTQTGSGAGIRASTSNTTSSSNAVVGTISGPGVAIYGSASSTSAQAYGVQGNSASTIGIGLLGFATATTGSTYGLKGYSSSTGGTGVRGLSTATTGSTTGISASVASAAGTAGVFNNTAGGKILSGQNNGVEKFSVDGGGDVNSAAGTYRIGGNSVLNIGSAADNNLFLGVGAGAANVAGSGISNVFAGYQAGLNNTSGYGNVFAGYLAGQSNTTACCNTFYGAQAGTNTTGLQNTFVGYEAGYSNITGQNNIFSGQGAGYHNTTGSSNVFYGSSAGYNNVNGSSDIYVGNQGPTSSESNTIRIGTPGSGTGQQNVAYMAGIYGNAPSSALPVVVNANGQLGTTTGGIGVTSFNNRSGAVVPQTDDYSFSMIGGTLQGSQLGGTYSGAVTLSNTSNVYYGNGSNLTAVIPGPGSPYYIQNGTSLQPTSNFNISGTGAANSFVSATNYQIGTFTVLTSNSSAFNLFVGAGAGNAGGGSYNAFSGWDAGYTNIGTSNTFTGYAAGYDNYGGGDNTYTGFEAGYGVPYTSTLYNTFTGYQAGFSNQASGNTFTGYLAGGNNIGGPNNAFYGFDAGIANTNGGYNVFDGYEAGYMNTVGSYNIFSGYQAGYNNTGGSSDIYIGNAGPSSGGESGTIRIGTQGTGLGQQAAAYIAGIYGSSSPSGVSVYVNSNGQLGTVLSSLRFKEQVRDMGDSTNALMNLRPVTFLYKPEYDKGSRTLQYGLIAEEVAKVYPELVAYDNDGKPYTVRYQYLAPMLLNEVQKQYRRAEEQSEIVATQQLQIKAQRQEIDGLKHELQLQNAALQERLSKLESYVATQTQTKTASDVQPSATATPSGDSQ